jgi:GrpB-like predicted nucleotidyltransferase (UPF0157 family)/GNAT superfamily N-acetyltransferase
MRITIADYDPAWPQRYEQERERIAAALGASALRIEHIGSTSVPCLAAKPIVDVLVTVADPEDDPALAPLLDAGYELRVVEPGHRMFRTPARDVHVHVWGVGHPEVVRYLAFRQRLRANAGDRANYERLKRKLAKREWETMDHYANAKSDLIEAILAKPLRSPPVAVDVRPVRGFADLRAFVALPFRLHAGTKWIPPLKLERYLFLSKRMNAYFKHGEAEYFLARRDGRVVGRITAQIDRAFNDFHENRWGMFGFLEFENDQQVADALLNAAEGWLRERACDRMVGPMDFAMNDEAGVLIEGFDLEPMIKQPWHPPHYQERCEAAGLEKAMDLYMWHLHISGRENMLPILPEFAERARTKHGINIRKMSRLHLRRELDDFATIYNEAWSSNWGFVPYSKEDLDAYAMELQLVYDRDWFMVAEEAGKTVAIAITVPDINQVLQKMRGRLLPLGWWYFLNKGRIIDRVRVGFLGVLPAYQHTGVAAALYVEHFDMADQTRRKGGEMGWILETNHSMNRAMEAMGGRIVKRYRVYERVF